MDTEDLTSSSHIDVIENPEPSPEARPPLSSNEMNGQMKDEEPDLIRIPTQAPMLMASQADEKETEMGGYLESDPISSFIAHVQREDSQLMDASKSATSPGANFEEEEPELKPARDPNLMSSITAPRKTGLEPINAPTGVIAGDEHPEWEIDSSPIESSSEDSSDGSSSDDSDEDDNSYKFLSPEEQARILMQGDGGSDDEDAVKGIKASTGQLRTKNEVPEEVIPKPDVVITPEMPIQELGLVEAIVENILLVKARISGEYRVLESGSVLCLIDRSVIGVVAETLGRVQQPLYSIRFTNPSEMAQAGLAVGVAVFYSEQHSTYVFTQALKAYKGSDASNMHDEEVAEEEVEFSDDEAEMEHKRRLKQRKMTQRGGKMQQNGGPNRGGHLLRQDQPSPGVGMGLNYDEVEDDGPYTPLARPSGFATGPNERSQEGFGPSERSTHSCRNGDQFRGRERGDRGRGRGDRGRGGERGRGRGGFQDRRRESNGYSLPSQDRNNEYALPPLRSPGANFSPGGWPQSPNGPPTSNNLSHIEYSPQQPLIWPQYPPQNPFPQSYQQAFQNMQNGWPNLSSAAPMPSGAFINPAFFTANQIGRPSQWSQQGQQKHQGSGGAAQ